MKKGLIVYNKVDQEKNQWFIDRCLKELNNDSFSLLYKEESETLTYAKENKINFVIFRARNYHLVQELEGLGIRVFNNSQTNRIANDKYQSFLFCKANDLACLETYEDSKYVSNYFFVMKSVDGHGGKDVYLVESEEYAKKILEETHKKYIYQRFIANASDVRLYVLNKQVVAAVKRENKHNFRSNYSLGGEVSDYLPTLEMLESAIKIATLLDSDYIGVDFIVNDETCFINEIEDPVGSRMLYATSDIDIVSLFIEHIKTKLTD